MKNAEKIRCRSCQALNDSDRKTCEKCGAILVPENAIVIKDPTLNCESCGAGYCDLHFCPLKNKRGRKNVGR